MATTRRDILRLGVGSFLGVSLTAGGGASKAEAKAAVAELAMRPLDYGRSFLSGTARFNSVRFWVESRTRIIDDKSGQHVDYYQCASCKSENTFGEKDLFYKDNYDFLPIFGGDDLLIFRRPARLNERYRAIHKAADVWGKPALKLPEARAAVVLNKWEQIRDASAAGIPIVTQTEIANADTGLRAIIECPTKTLNISLDNKMYQVDTGPIAYPDLSKRHEPPIACLSLAFVAFNAPHFADFVVEQPTPVTKIYHYSNPFSVPAKNRVIALGKMEK